MALVNGKVDPNSLTMSVGGSAPRANNGLLNSNGVPTPPPAGTTKVRYDPTNAEHRTAAAGVYGRMQELVNGGNEQGARDFYNQNQQMYGFTDDEFAPTAYKGDGADGSKGYYSAADLAAWKTGKSVNDINNPKPVTAATTATTQAPQSDSLTGDYAFQQGRDSAYNQATSRLDPPVPDRTEESGKPVDPTGDHARH